MHTLAHCCLQGFCCPPGSEEQKNALAGELDKDLGLSARKDEAVTGLGRAVAEWIDDNDMALVPKSIAVAIHEAHIEANNLKPGSSKGNKKD